MDHDSGLDVPGTLEINACIMIPAVLFHRRRREGNSAFLIHLSHFESIAIRHREIPVSPMPAGTTHFPLINALSNFALLTADANHR